MAGQETNVRPKTLRMKVQLKQTLRSVSSSSVKLILSVTLLLSKATSRRSTKTSGASRGVIT